MVLLSFVDANISFTVLSCYSIIEYSAFAFYLYSVIDNRIFKTIIIASTIGFYIFALTTFVINQNQNFDSLAASVESILIISFCIFYLFDQLNKPQVIFIYQEPSFWFVVGFMVYLSGTLFLFIQADNLEKSVRENFWKILLISNTIKNILFAIAFSTRKGKSINPSPEVPYDDFFEKPFKS